MNRVLIIAMPILFIFLLLCNPYCYAQIDVNISKPRLEIKDNNVNIYYDILNSKQTDKFKIWIEITDSAGSKINAKALSGDIGWGVNGGSNKNITWNLTADSIYLNAVIYFQINAEILKTAETTETTKTPETTEIGKPMQSISRGGAILRSVIFPGWGLSYLKKGKLHLIKGALGYGCLATSIVYNKKAASSYNDYLNLTNFQESEKFFNDAVKADNISEALAYTAIGIWVTDIIWTVAGSSKLKGNKAYSQSKGLSIKTIYSPNVTPLMILTYNF